MSSLFRLAILGICGIALIGMDSSLVLGQGAGGENDDDPRGSTERKEKQTRKVRFEELLAEKNLDKFRGYAQEAIGDGWKLQGKYLHFDGKGGGDIITRETYTDFELQFGFKVSEGANSGVMYRVSLGDKAPYFSGPEYQVLDDAAHADGKKAETSAGSLYAMYAPGEGKRVKKAGQWNTAKIVIDGDKISHYLNGKKVVAVELGSDDWNEKLAASKFKDWPKFGKNSSGHIAFQDHGNEVWFRDIRVKRLNTDKPVQSNATARSTAAKKNDTSKPNPRANSRFSKFAKKEGWQDALSGAAGGPKKKPGEEGEEGEGEGEGGEGGGEGGGK